MQRAIKAPRPKVKKAPNGQRTTASTDKDQQGLAIDSLILDEVLKKCGISIPKPALPKASDYRVQTGLFDTETPVKKGKKEKKAKPSERWLRIDFSLNIGLGIAEETRVQIHSLLDEALNNAKSSGAIECRNGIYLILESNLDILKRHIELKYRDDFELKVEGDRITFSPFVHTTDEHAWSQAS